MRETKVIRLSVADGFCYEVWERVAPGERYKICSSTWLLYVYSGQPVPDGVERYDADGHEPLMEWGIRGTGEHQSDQFERFCDENRETIFRVYPEATNGESGGLRWWLKNPPSRATLDNRARELRAELATVEHAIATMHAMVDVTDRERPFVMYRADRA